MIAHFYHVYADGHDWLNPLAEHLKALRVSGLRDKLDDFYIGLVGSEGQRTKVKVLLDDQNITGFIEADIGWEQVTLNALYQYAITHPEGQVFYAHTKGASTPTPFNIRWREAMTRVTVGRWSDALRGLESSDVVGPFLNVSKSREHGGLEFFAGNFFWANLDALRALDAPNMYSRWEAEVWVSDPNLTRKTLYPGFPSESLFDEVLRD